MPRSDTVRRALLGLLAMVVITIFGTSMAAADEPDPAKQKAAEAVATKVCTIGQLDTLLKSINLDDDCMNKVKALYADGPDGITASRICSTVMPGKALTIPRAQCNVTLMPVVRPMVKLWQASYDAAKAVKTGIEIAKFVANPQDGVDSLANQTKQAGVSLAQVMATDLIKSTPSFDATQGWWGAKYRQALVLGLVLLAAMTLWTIRDAAINRNDEELVSSILIRLPIAVLAMCFAPAIGMAITAASNAIAQAAVPTFASDLDKFLARITDVSAVTMAAGSAIVGILLFGLLFIGVALTIGALLMHTLALYLTGVAMAIVWGMYVNPRWRPQVNRVTAFWVSTAFAKPLLIFMLGVAFAIAGNLKAGVGSLEEILNIGLIALTILMVGLTPLALLKFIPILPAATESMRTGGGGSIIGAAGSAASSVAMSRASWGTQREKSSSASTSKQTNTQTSGNTSTGGSQGTGQSGRSGASGPGQTGPASQGAPGQAAQGNGQGQGQSGQPQGGQGQGGQSPPTDPAQVTQPVTGAGGKVATAGAVAAGSAAGGPVGAAAAAALAAGAKTAGEKARQTAAGVAPDINRQDGGER